MTEAISFNNISNDNYFNISWQNDSNKYYLTDGTWITSPQEFIIDSSGNVINNIPSFTIVPIGTLRVSDVNSMIERWDGTNWVEYGKPLEFLSPQPPKADDDFELGGAL